MVYCITSCEEANKGLVINYGEGGGATKWEHSRSETFATPPPSIWLKRQATI